MKQPNFQTVLITGSAIRIGKAIAIHLAEKGYRIVLHYNTSINEAKDTLNELNNINGLENITIQFDFKLESPQNSLFDILPLPIDILINNAAILTNDFHAANIFQVNLFAPIALTNIAIDRGIKVINILDAQSVFGKPTNLRSYHISKKLFYKFTKYIGEFHPVFGITCGAMLFKENQSEPVYKAIKKEHNSNTEDLLKAITKILKSKYSIGSIFDI